MRFRRQHPVERFVLDFYCPAVRLAVEVDGGHHNTDDARTHDAERTAYLEALDIRVLRFWNHDVLADIGVVLRAISLAYRTAHTKYRAAEEGT